MIRFYPIEPMAKPRMTRSDAITMSKLRAKKPLNEREQKRAAILGRWLAYSDEVRIRGVVLPESNYHVIFVLPMPKRWSKARKEEMRGMPHRGKQDGVAKNDKDNLEKGLLDIMYGDDSSVWDGRVSKIWYDYGGIFVVNPVASGWRFEVPFDVHYQRFGDNEAAR